jgi:asparagine synthase (glutamine-hydrolysing)
MGKLQYKNFGYKVQKIAFSLMQKTNADLYDNLISSCPDVCNSFSNYNFDLGRKKIKMVKNKNFVDSMMLTDIKYYLPDDILCKVDRASMWNGVEVRSPFLHHSLVEYCLKMPASLMFNNKENKWILRKLIKNYMPNYNSEVKMGFSSPVDNWLKNEIKDIFQSCLDRNFINKQAIFDYNFVLNKWNEHLNGKRNWGKYLWSFLIFQKWSKKNHN